MGLQLLAEYDALVAKRKSKRYTQAAGRRLDRRIADLARVLIEIGAL